ncbi:MAG: LamG-like jellyroll fold domain-containing protein [Cyanobacteria bacterium J06634_5]
MNNSSIPAANLSIPLLKQPPEQPPKQPPKQRASRTFFVAPSGSDDNAGTLDAPFATLTKANDAVQAGDTIYMRGGTYKPAIDKIIKLTKSGTQENPIRLFAYKDERPVIDGSDWTRRSSAAGGKMLIDQTGDYWHVKGLEMTGSPRQGYLATSVKGSIYENLNIHDNDNTGLTLAGDGTENNLILGGDFYRNYDPFRKGQDADGIAIKQGSGKGNVIRGARTYYNSDDGIDLYAFNDSVTIENTRAYGNGVDRWDVGSSFDGDGAGFRLSSDVGPVAENKNIAHVIRNNLAWDNTVRGFNYNGSQGKMQVYNNTSYNNGVSYAFNKGSHVLRNNIAIGGDLQIARQKGVKDDNNSWTLGVTATAEDFLSVDSTRAEGARQADGSLPDTDFLKLKPGSDLIDVGVDVGREFAGSAPDLGAFESGSPTVLPVVPPAEPPITTDKPTKLVASYSFDNMISNIAYDNVGDTAGLGKTGNNPGRLYGATRDEGERGRYVKFDGNDLIKIANTQDINLGIQKQRTVSLRFKVEGTATGDRKQVLYEEGAGVRGLNAYVYDDRLFVGGWNRPVKESGWTGTWLETPDVEADTWHRLTLVIDGDVTTQSEAMIAYLDGEEFGRGDASQLWAHTGGIGLGGVNGGTLFHDGTKVSSGSGLVGALDEVRIYNSALTEGQVQGILA